MARGHRYRPDPKLIAVGDPAVALPGATVRMPLSPPTVRGWASRSCARPAPRALSVPARPGHGFCRGRCRARARRGAAPVRPPAPECEHRRLADARDQPLPPAAGRERPEQGRAQLDSRSPPCSSWDPTTRTCPLETHQSVDRPLIPAATLHEVSAGHGPWLVDPEGVARLATDALAAGATAPSRRGRRRVP